MEENNPVWVSHLIVCTSVSSSESRKVSPRSKWIQGVQCLTLGTFLASDCQDEGRRLLVAGREQRTEVRAGRGVGTGLQSAWKEPGRRGVIYCCVEGLGRESSFRVRVCLGARRHVQS